MPSPEIVNLGLFPDNRREKNPYNIIIPSEKKDMYASQKNMQCYKLFFLLLMLQMHNTGTYTTLLFKRCIPDTNEAESRPELHRPTQQLCCSTKKMQPSNF
jgi:hypothetical protein